MKQLVLESVQPGDIILTARPALVSKLIRVATSGLVSHAMICVQHGSVIDSTSEGVQARNLQREPFADDELVYHLRPKRPLTDSELSKIIDYARSQIGTRYSVPEALRTKIRTGKSNLTRQFCSRLVARAYSSADISLVPQPDYCSPEDLRISPLLEELTVSLEQISEGQEAWLASSFDLTFATRRSQNEVLDAARKIDASVETFDDLYALLRKLPESDKAIASALRDSGYLELWQNEVQLHAYRYDLDLMRSTAFDPAEIRRYCILTVRDTYSAGFRFSENLIGLKKLNHVAPRESFQLLIRLYNTLVANDQARREVAIEWLRGNFPKDLADNLERIEPHSPKWYSFVDAVEPNLAMLSRAATSAEGSINVCSSCGDIPSNCFRVVNGAETMPGVPSLRLCDDCASIRRDMGNILEVFL